MPQSRLVKYIPESVVFERVPLADEQNAYGPWLEATKCLYRPPDEEEVFWSLVYPDSETGEGIEYPTGKEAERVREILEKNRRAFELVNAGIARSGFQMPELTGIEENKLFFSGIENLISFHLVNARRLLAERSRDLAVRTSLVLSRIGGLTESSSVPILPILVLVIPGYNRTMSSVKRIVADPKISDANLQELLALLKQQRKTIGCFCKGLQHDLCYETLSDLEHCPDDADIEEVVDAVLKEYYPDELYMHITTESNTDQKVLDPAVQADLDQRLAWRRDKILFLLESHPCPFDKVATARQMGEQVAAMEASFWETFEAGESYISDYTEWPADRARAELESWPQHLMPSWPVDLLGDSRTVDRPKDATDEEAFHADIIEMLAMAATGSELSSRPTHEELVEVRERITTVFNPLGNLILFHAFSTGRQLCNSRLEVNVQAKKLEGIVEERLRQQL